MPFQKGQIPWNRNGGEFLTLKKRRKITEFNKGKHFSLDTEFKKGLTPWNKGLKTAEVITKNCLNCNKVFQIPVHKIKHGGGIFCSIPCKNEFYKADFAKRMRELPESTKQEQRRKISNSLKGRKVSKKTRQKIGNKNRGENNGMYGRKQSQKARDLISKASWERWQNKEYKERVIKKTLKALLKRPTGLEYQMINIIKKHNLPYKYTGDGDFWIGGKNPDFVNINGEKKLIEVGNVFHHQGNYVEKRRKHFAKYGWESHIFINDKLDEKEIIKKLKEIK